MGQLKWLIVDNTGILVEIPKNNIWLVVSTHFFSIQHTVPQRHSESCRNQTKRLYKLNGRDSPVESH